MIDPTRKPRILDLFCGAGGASMGYAQAGFDVVGVDIHTQPHYPFEFIKADALRFVAQERPEFDVIHASPPCQDHSALRHRVGAHGTGWLLAATLRLLEAQAKPFIIENVPGSGPDLGGQWIVLCGSSFGLKVRRHRLFRSNVALMALPCRHREQGQPLGVYGTGGGGQMTRGRKATPSEAKEAMGIDWMTRAEIAQALPPVYTEFLGAQLIASLERAA